MKAVTEGQFAVESLACGITVLLHPSSLALGTDDTS